MNRMKQVGLVILCYAVFIGVAIVCANTYTIRSSIIHIPAKNLSLTYTESGTELTLTATLDTLKPGVLVEFFQCNQYGGDLVSKGTATTDSSGTATIIITYDPSLDSYYMAGTNG